MREHPSNAKAPRTARPETGGWHDTLADGTPIWIRPVHKEDAKLEREFLRRLSRRGLHDRFVGVVQAPSEAVAQHLTSIDGHAGDVALIALVKRDGKDVEVGAGGYARNHHGQHCHAAIAIDDGWRKLGVGTLLAKHLIDMARAAGIKRAYVVDPVVHPGHHQFAERMGFRRCPDPDDPAASIFELEL